MPREIRPFQPSDAATVAQKMWNESDSAWPWGFTHGVPFTAERVLRDEERRRGIVTYIAFADGRAVGYCSLTEFWDDPRVAYVRLLGAHPAYHGQGIGRDLLRAALRRTLDLGYDRLDLHTWAGNLKAVPLYKKTGFFWVPSTSVHMHNYLPTVFKLAAARRFFRFGEPDEIEWYTCFRRDLSVRPDEWEERGMRVFPYEFVADGRRLRVLVDLESRGVTSVETDDLAGRLLARLSRGRTLATGIAALALAAFLALNLAKGYQITVHDDTHDSTILYEYVVENVPAGETVGIAYAPTYHLGRELFFRTGGRKFVTETLPDLLAHPPSSVFILAYPSTAAVDAVKTRFPGATFVAEVGDVRLKSHFVVLLGSGQVAVQ